MLDYALARRAMVDSQLRTFDVNDMALLAVVDALPRERFVPRGREGLAYIDRDIAVSDGVPGAERRFMLSPMVLGRLIQNLALAPGHRVLDVACGLGYGAAVMARLGVDVVALETSEALAREARSRLESIGVATVSVAVGPLAEGHPAAAPYDAILINGSIETRPEALLRQLKDGGRLACLEARGRVAKATVYVRSGDAFGSRQVFDAGAAKLDAFRAEKGFVF